MDAFSDPLIENVVVMSSAQVGKTEAVNNVVGFFIDRDPSPILVLQPTLELAEAWSKDRLAPMIRDTPALRGKVKDARSRDSENTLLHKKFPGGHITMAGSNAPASLASRPIRAVLCDEVDRYPVSAGTEGDPVDLARKRTTTFWNRKIGLFSTPTVKGASRIEAAYEASDKRRYWVPCPHCDEFQPLWWRNVRWPEGHPELACYHCEHCGAEITDAHKPEMFRRGEWRAENEFRGAAGFHLSELYSPWVSFGRMACSFVEAKKLPETLRVWINTSLGETWEEEGEQADDAALLNRREDFGPEVPWMAGLLTAGVDVQDDRLEAEVVAWGKDFESWSMDYAVFHGDPARPDVWRQLDDYLAREWRHEGGRGLRISAACVDTGGHHTTAVYRYCKPRFARRVWAIKGGTERRAPFVGRPTKSNVEKCPLFSVNPHVGKDALFSRLRIEEPGPGYCHFNHDRDAAYFEQLTAEKAVTKYVKGRPEREWVKVKRRNEALDVRIYAMAAYTILNPAMDKLLGRMQAAPEAPKAPEEKTSRPQPKRNGFVQGWRE